MVYENIRTFIELQSLAWTMPVLAGCALVVYECQKSLRSNKGDKKSKQLVWILLGICIGFTGNFVDNLYWLIPWTMSYVGCVATPDAVAAGVFPNLIFRQMLTATSAYCHIRAFISPDDNQNTKTLNKVFIVSLVIGYLYTASLMAFRFYYYQ